VMMALLAVSPSHASEPRFPLKVGEGRRILVDQEGAPFLVVGDTAWSLIVQPREADIDHYLDDRQGRGFNSIIVNLIEHKFCATPPRTRAGLVPFKRSGDLSSPNPAYFDFAHRVVKKAGDRGILVWLTPAYLGAGGGDEGWFREITDRCANKVKFFGWLTRPEQSRIEPSEACADIVPQPGGTPRATAPGPNTPGCASPRSSSDASPLRPRD
jgi:hypothetical protein